MKNDIDLIKIKGDIIQFPTEKVDDNDRSEKRTIKNVNIRKSALEVSKRQIAKKKKMALKRKIIGIIAAATAGAATSCAVSNIFSPDVYNIFPAPINSFQKKIVNTVIDKFPVDVSIDEINGLDVVLVNDGIDSDVLDKCQADLAEMGINVQVKDINDNDLDGANTFIAFKTYKGDKEMAVANYEGEQSNHASDFLTVAMAASFNDKDSDVEASDIQRGNYEITYDHTWLTSTNIEKKVKGLAMVTVDIPSGQDIDASKIANGLARYWGYYKLGGSVYDEPYLERKYFDSEGGNRVEFARKLEKPFRAADKINLTGVKENTNNKENGF